MPPLFAGGALCLGLLVRHRVPGLAWASLVFASLVAAGVPIALSRAVDPGAWARRLAHGRRPVDRRGDHDVGIAALWYATRPERPAARRVTTVATLLVAWLTTGCLARHASSSPAHQQTLS